MTVECFKFLVVVCVAVKNSIVFRLRVNYMFTYQIRKMFYFLLELSTSIKLLSFLSDRPYFGTSVLNCSANKLITVVGNA